MKKKKWIRQCWQKRKRKKEDRIIEKTNKNKKMCEERKYENEDEKQI